MDKPDANAAEITEAIRALGFRVERICFANHRKGCPDLLVIGFGHAILAEIKAPLGPRGGKSGRSLRPEQEAFRADCEARGVEVHIWRSREDAIRALVPMRRRPALKLIS